VPIQLTPFSFIDVKPFLRFNERFFYLRQGGYVYVVVCLSVSNFAQKLQVLYEIFREGWQWESEQMIKFWWRSESRMNIRIRIRIATPVRRTLAEVCTVPVLLVSYVITS